jgi:hypothetical protein
MDDLWQMDPLFLCPFYVEAFEKSDRQRRLCGCFLVRQILWDLIPEQLRTVVEASEQFADGLLERKQFFALTRASRKPYRSLQARFFRREEPLSPNDYAVGHAYFAVNTLADPKFSPTTLRVTGSQIWQTVRSFLEGGSKTKEEKSEITTKVKEQFTTLPEEILGTGGNGKITPRSWSRNVLGLALAMYEGERCHFALHDALEEESQAELAKHFLKDFHPKGCWALDLILGKN